MELLRELVSHTAMIAVLMHPKNPHADTFTRYARAVARAVGQQIHIPHVNTTSEAEAASDTEVPLPLLALADEVIV